MPQLRIGISGWRYGPWRGTFYPEGLAQKRELEYVGSQLNSVEINGTFYSLQRPSSFQSWSEQVPDDFVFAIKGGRYITHVRRLRDVRQPLANFFASGVLGLKQKLGPILWQLPPFFKFDAGVIEEFLSMLPADTEEAARLARKHDPWMKKRSMTKIDRNRPLRHAMEFRNASFLDKKFVRLLRKYKVAMVFADTAKLFPYSEDVTADFIYIRLHGAEEIYTSGYTPEALDHWAGRIRAWSAGKEPKDAAHAGPAAKPRKSGRNVYAYFDNDRKVRAPVDAMELARKLGVKAREDGSSTAKQLAANVQ